LKHRHPRENDRNARQDHYCYMAENWTAQAKKYEKENTDFLAKKAFFFDKAFTGL